MNRERRIQTSEIDNATHVIPDSNNQQKDLKTPEQVTDGDTDADGKRTPSFSPEAPKIDRSTPTKPSLNDYPIPVDGENIPESIDETDVDGNSGKDNAKQSGSQSRRRPLSPRNRDNPNYPSSSDAPNEHNVTPALDQEPENDVCYVLSLQKMGPYKFIKSHVKAHKDQLAVILGILMVMQVFLVAEDSYVSYEAKSTHSGCKCSFPFPWLLTFLLRFYSRLVIPLTISIMFWRQIVRQRSPSRVGKDGKSNRSAQQALSAELMRPINEKTVRAFTEKHWNPALVNASAREQLESVQKHFESKLTYMLVFATFQPVILLLALLLFNVFTLNADQMPRATILLGLADILSLSLVSAASGFMLSFYFIEVDMKKYIRCLCAINGALKGLISKAKTIETCITDKWYPLEIGMRFSSAIYPLFLIVSWAADTPLSCGFSVTIDALNDSAGCWLVFILSIGVGQLLTASPLKPHLLGAVGLTCEIVLLVLLWFFSPTYEWSALTHILYAVIPLCFLMWYNIVSIDRQLVAINRGNNQTHVSRLFSRSGLLALICLGLTMSLATDFRHVHPSAIGKYDGFAGVDPSKLPSTEYNLLRFCNMHPDGCVITLKGFPANVKQEAYHHDPPTQSTMLEVMQPL